MKKSFLFLMAGVLVCFSACDPEKKKKEEPKDPTFQEASFHQKHLLEEFTGQDCGYCPEGMNQVHEFIGNSTDWVTVLHHYGYKADNFSVKGGDVLMSKLGVNGAPSIVIDRKKPTGKSLVMNPISDLPKMKTSTFDAETYASVVITPTYDAATGALTVNVSGQIGKEDAPALYLTVLIKESGMIDYQHDYYYTYEGWQEFRHVNAVRAFLTSATKTQMGDEIFPEMDKDGKMMYSADFSTTLKSAWNADNCMVVAFLSDNATKGVGSIIQVEETPVVAGSKGGADIMHGGITAVPVSENYPEPDGSAGPMDYADADTIVLNQGYAQYTTYSQYGFNYWEILSYNQSTTYSVGGQSACGCADIYLFTATSNTTLPDGTFEFTNDEVAGTAYAGFRDDSQFQIGGSEFMYVSKSYMQQGYLVPVYTWLISAGTLTINGNSFTVVGTTRGGKPVVVKGAIQQQGKASSPLRKMGRDNFNFGYPF
ncbi:MAG: Omp28-related outer membrane protein [Paludibacteraceae bacterium]|nr:Omp28-related outer membrane protein [Paludibacteraceae bacterium]